MPIFVEDSVQNAMEYPTPEFDVAWSHTWNRVGWMRAGNFVLDPKTGMVLFEDGTIREIAPLSEVFK